MFCIRRNADQIVVNKVMSIEQKDWTQGPEYLVPRFNFHFIDGNVKAGSYMLGKVQKVDGDISKVAVTGLNGHKAALSVTDGNLVLTIADMRQAAGVAWSGAQSSMWDIADAENFTNTSEKTSDVFVSGDHVTFNDNATSGTVVIKGEVSPASITFDNNKLEYDLSGDAITGNTTITKKGTATAKLRNVNDFTGSVSIENGTLATVVRWKHLPISLPTIPLCLAPRAALSSWTKVRRSR